MIGNRVCGVQTVYKLFIQRYLRILYYAVYQGKLMYRRRMMVS